MAQLAHVTQQTASTLLLESEVRTECLGPIVNFARLDVVAAAVSEDGALPWVLAMVVAAASATVLLAAMRSALGTAQHKRKLSGSAHTVNLGRPVVVVASSRGV